MRVPVALSGGLPSEHEVTLLSLQQQDNDCDVVWEEVRVRCSMLLCVCCFNFSLTIFGASPVLALHLFWRLTCSVNQRADEQKETCIDFDDPPALPTPIARANVYRNSSRSSLHGRHHGLPMSTTSSTSAQFPFDSGARMSQLRLQHPVGGTAAVPLRTDSSMVHHIRRLRTLSIAAGGEWLDGSLFGMS